MAEYTQKACPGPVFFSVARHNVVTGIRNYETKLYKKSFVKISVNGIYVVKFFIVPL